MSRNYVYGAGSLRNIATLTRPLQEICHEGLKIANTRKLFCPDISIVRGRATAEEQRQIFLKGRKEVDYGYEIVGTVFTNCDGVYEISDHQKLDGEGLGLAFDFCAWVDSKGNYEDGYIALIATCFMEAASNLGYRIDWGGNYRSISDGSHIGYFGSFNECN